jgi:hypothetical protein
MTAPALPTVLKLGPGKVTFGAAGALVDASCAVNSARITTAAASTEATYKLCGTAVPGTSTLTSQFTGNVDVNGEADGLFQFASEHAGEVVPFTFLPHGTRDGATGVVTPGTGDLEARGSVVILPLDFGGDTYGDNLTSDFTYELTGASVDFYRDGTLAWSQPIGPLTAAAPVGP